MRRMIHLIPSKVQLRQTHLSHIRETQNVLYSTCLWQQPQHLPLIRRITLKNAGAYVAMRQ